MIQIKTFKFKILSNCTDNNTHMYKQNAHDEYDTLYTTERIDNEINEFCSDKNVKDIKINEIYEQNVQNGTNKVILFYTICFEKIID